MMALNINPCRFMRTYWYDWLKIRAVSASTILAVSTSADENVFYLLVETARAQGGHDGSIGSLSIRRMGPMTVT